MEFNYAHSKQADPNWTGDLYAAAKMPQHMQTAPLQAQRNLSFLQYIDLVELLWGMAHPEITFGPIKPDKAYDPDKGYIAYSLENRVTTPNNTKPRFRQEVDHPTKDGDRISIWTQSFQNTISFTSLHRNPRVAEETIEAFEDFIIEGTPVFKRLGIEELVYGRRIADDHDRRYGEDISARTVYYQVTTQKVMPVEQSKLKELIFHIASLPGQDPAWAGIIQ